MGNQWQLPEVIVPVRRMIQFNTTGLALLAAWQASCSRWRPGRHGGRWRCSDCVSSPAPCPTQRQFEQVVTAQSGRRPQRPRACFFPRPGRFHWRRPPYRQVLVGDGKTCDFGIPTSTQVTVRAIGEALGHPAAILFDSARLDDNFETRRRRRAGLAWAEASKTHRAASVACASGWLKARRGVWMRDHFGRPR